MCLVQPSQIILSPHCAVSRLGIGCKTSLRAQVSELRPASAGGAQPALGVLSFLKRRVIDSPPVPPGVFVSLSPPAHSRHRCGFDAYRDTRAPRHPGRPRRSDWPAGSIPSDRGPGGAPARGFYRRPRAFLHFHHDPKGMFADVRFGDDFVRLPVDTLAQQADLVARVRAGGGGAGHPLSATNCA